MFANYSWLSARPPIHIAATELRGITIEQLSALQLGLDARQFVILFLQLHESKESNQSENIMSHHITSSQTQLAQLGIEVGLRKRLCLQLVRSTPFGIRAAFVF